MVAKGSKLSVETRAKMREAALDRWRKGVYRQSMLGRPPNASRTLTKEESAFYRSRHYRVRQAFLNCFSVWRPLTDKQMKMLQAMQDQLDAERPIRVKMPLTDIMR